MGHGPPTTPALLDWQAKYIRSFLDAIQSVDPAASDEEAVREVTERMKAFLDTEDLLFLMQLSVSALRHAK